MIPLASFKSLNGGDNSPATLRNRRKCWERHVGFNFPEWPHAAWPRLQRKEIR